jgi:hypothetical protein
MNDVGDLKFSKAYNMNPTSNKILMQAIEIINILFAPE